MPNNTMALRRFEYLLFFLTILFLPTQLGKHFWPSFAYIYSLKIDYLSPALYFWDILAVGLLLVWLLQKPKINKLALNLFLLFLFSQALSLLTAANIGAGLIRIEQYLVAGLFGVFLASLDFKTLEKKIYLPLLLAIIGESVLAIWQFINGSTLGLWILGERSFNITTPGIAKFDFYGRQFLRPYATFPHPNVLAAFMVIAAMLASFWPLGPESLGIEGLVQNQDNKDSGVGTYQDGTSLPRMTLLKISVLLAGITTFLTISRTAILVGIVSLALTVPRRWFTWVILVLLIISPVLFIRFTSVLNFDSLALIRREELIGNAWEMFIKSPILGAGLNNFIPVSSGNLLTGPSRFLQPVHNILLLVLSETGLVGLVGFILLVGYPIWKISKFKYQISKMLPWVIILFLGMFDHYFLTLPQGYRMFFLIWGLTLSMLK